jgi:hypothetical protein
VIIRVKQRPRSRSGAKKHAEKQTAIDGYGTQELRNSGKGIEEIRRKVPRTARKKTACLNLSASLRLCGKNRFHIASGSKVSRRGAA